MIVIRAGSAAPAAPRAGHLIPPLPSRRATVMTGVDAIRDRRLTCKKRRVVNVVGSIESVEDWRNEARGASSRMSCGLDPTQCHAVGRLA